MNINMDLRDYSYTDSIGTTLRQPLIKLVSNVATAVSGNPYESIIERVVKVVFHCLVATVFILPAGVAFITGKTIYHFSKNKIDPSGLKLAPPPIQIVHETEADVRVNIEVLVDRFNALNIPERNTGNRTSKQQFLKRLCNWVKTQNSNIYPDDINKRALFCAQLSIMLKRIVKKIESGEVSRDKEKQILLELAEAATRCYPTWLEAGAKLFAEVDEQPETVQVKLLRLVQDYKEAIILEFVQGEVGAQWHALNYMRNILGKELGLNMSLNVYDPYAGHDDPGFGKNLSKWLFVQKYENVNRLITAIHTKINFQSYDESFNLFLINIARKQGIQSPEDYTLKNFYTEDYKLKLQGVNLMLRSIGVIKG